MQKFHYKTDRHQLFYTKQGENLFKEHKLSLAFQYKPAINNTHIIELEGSKMSTQYSVENPTFFLNDMLNFQYAQLRLPLYKRKA